MKNKKRLSVVILTSVFAFASICWSFNDSGNDANNSQADKNNTTQAVKQKQADTEQEALWSRIKEAEAELVDYIRKNQPLPPARNAGETKINEYLKAYEEFQKGQLKYAAGLLELAEQYYTKFPDGPYAKENMKRLINGLRIVPFLNDYVMRPQDKKLYQRLLQDKDLTAEQANDLLTINYMITVNLREKLKSGKEQAKKDYSDMLDQMEKQIKDLEVRFRGNQLIAGTCIAFAEEISDTDKDRAVRILDAIKKDADEKTREFIEAMSRRWNIVGSRPVIKFKTVDGKEVDLEKLRGKVVLIDFWATWCPPCRAELPNVLKVYEKYHNKGFEIIGISFDRDIETLKQFVQENGITWPQYSDGKFWDNDIGRYYGINAIPTMWLVDKDGRVVDAEAGSNLPEKIAKMLGVK